MKTNHASNSELTNISQLTQDTGYSWLAQPSNTTSMSYSCERFVFKSFNSYLLTRLRFRYPDTSKPGWRHNDVIRLFDMTMKLKSVTEWQTHLLIQLFTDHGLLVLELLSQLKSRETSRPGRLTRATPDTCDEFSSDQLEHGDSQHVRCLCLLFKHS